MSNPNRRGPRALSEILGDLFTVRGYGRLRGLSELEEAWNQAVGEPHCHDTQLGEVRRGVLNVTVAHSTLLEELAAFRKSELLQALRSTGGGAAIQDIRFRVGAIDRPAPASSGGAGPVAGATPPRAPRGRKAPARRRKRAEEGGRGHAAGEG
jgi:hypothetical protein